MKYLPFIFILGFLNYMLSKLEYANTGMVAMFNIICCLFAAVYFTRKD